MVNPSFLRNTHHIKGATSEVVTQKIDPFIQLHNKGFIRRFIQLPQRQHLIHNPHPGAQLPQRLAPPVSNGNIWAPILNKALMWVPI